MSANQQITVGGSDEGAFAAEAYGANAAMKVQVYYLVTRAISRSFRTS